MHARVCVCAHPSTQQTLLRRLNHQPHPSPFTSVNIYKKKQKQALFVYFAFCSGKQERITKKKVTERISDLVRIVTCAIENLTAGKEKHS